MTPGATIIQFTASGHTFVAGQTPPQLVEFQGLTSHTGMNGNAYEVTAVAGTTFKVAYRWNGNPDDVAGSAQRRVPGNVSTGLSGNILNFFTATRIDAALKALIYGPDAKPCDAAATGYCYIKAQGSRRYIRESSNVQAEFYVRPATSNSAATYPDDYSTPLDSYNAKTTYVIDKRPVFRKCDHRGSRALVKVL